MILLLVTRVLFPVALAAAPIDAPLQIELSLPPDGAVRVRLPPDVVGSRPRELAETLTLLGPDGMEVPFTVAASEPVSRLTEGLDFRTIGPGTWQVEPSSRWIDTLRLNIDDIESLGVVTVRVNDGPPTSLTSGNIDGRAVVHDTVAVPGGRGPWTVTAATASPYDLRLWGVIGEVDAPELVPENCFVVPAADPVLTETGWSQYGLDLGGPRFVRSIRVVTEEPVFERRTMVSQASESRDIYGNEFRIRRVSLAGTALDDSTMVGVDLGGDRLVVQVSTENGRILPISGFEVCSTGADLLVRNAGSGPHTLYVGGEGHEASGDLAAAKVELLREGQKATVAAELVPNPAYLSRVDREGVAETAAPLNLLRWRYVRPVEGLGWSRIALDRTVLAHARPELGDLRVVDADGREVPSLIRRTGSEAAWETPPFTREERGSVSRIRVELGADTAPVATVTLTTPRGVFKRTVRVLRDRGTITEPLRTAMWAPGAEEAVGREQSQLAIAVDQVLGRELLIEIENENNPPLPITGVTVTSPEWEVLAKLPAGARLIYGAPSAERPAYDLDLLQDLVFRERTTPATLGAETALGGPVLGGFEKLVMLGTVAALAAGLFGMIVRVLISGKREEPAG